MKKLKVGLLGMGRIGRLHGDNITYFVKNAEIVAAADPMLNSTMEEWAAELGIPKVYSDPMKVVQDPEVEAVFICTSTPAHAELSIAAAKAGKGGPCDTPFVHADEVGQSWCLELFPEFIHMEDAIKVDKAPLLPPGHINTSAEDGAGPIKWYNAFGSCGMECICQPEGVIGDARMADGEKAKAGVERTLDYLTKLVNDILEKYPAGKLPPIDKMTQRDPAAIEAVIKGPNVPGGRHIYTLEY